MAPQLVSGNGLAVLANLTVTEEYIPKVLEAGVIKVASACLQKHEDVAHVQTSGLLVVSHRSAHSALVCLHLDNNKAHDEYDLDRIHC